MFIFLKLFFSDSTLIVNWLSNISKDSGAFQLHADTLFVFIAFAFKENMCDLAREVFLGHPVGSQNFGRNVNTSFPISSARKIFALISLISFSVNGSVATSSLSALSSESTQLSDTYVSLPDDSSVFDELGLASKVVEFCLLSLGFELSFNISGCFAISDGSVIRLLFSGL